MPRLCDRCGCEVPDYAVRGALRLEIQTAPGEGHTEHRGLCSACCDLILEQWDDGGLTTPLRLEEIAPLELQAMDTRRETALMAATQTLDAAATSAEVLEQADAFLEWLRADDDLEDAAEGAPGR